MGNKKAPKNVTSNISAAANPATSSNAHLGNNSSILKSSFAPFRFAAPLFASVIQGLDAQHVRIHDTTTGRLLSEHATDSRASITCLDWGYYGGSSSTASQDKESKMKKRKRSPLPNGQLPPRDLVLAYGTSESQIQIYSPAESKVLKTLKDMHSKGIRDFKFVNDGREGKAYSTGGNGKLVQWDLRQGTALVSMTLPSGPANIIRPAGSQVICASHLAYLVNMDSKMSSTSYNASINNVHTIFDDFTRSQDPKHFLTIAEIDHCINVFEEGSPTLIGSLRTDNEVLAADFWSLGQFSTNGSQEIILNETQLQQVLAALNKDGAIEIFPEPFQFTTVSSGKNAESLKSRMKQRSRGSTAQIKVVRPDKRAVQVPLIDMSFHGNELKLAWVEGGVNVLFDNIHWRDQKTGNLLLNGDIEIVKQKSGAGLGSVSMNGVKDMGRSHVDDSHAVVSNGLDADDVSMEEVDTEVIDISSAEDESEFEEDQPVAGLSVLQQDVEGGKRSGQDEGSMVKGDEDMEDAEVQDEPQESEAGSPSFGDLIRANASDPIDVPNNLVDEYPHSLVPINPTSVQPLSSSLSLGTVLTQSLRTNDVNLLETCFHTQDLSTVRATIERLDSFFAATLLQRLAERLHSRPGRAGSLMVWIQWTLVAHGGYLAGQPEMMRKLKSLYSVVKERAGSLQSLLSLKGKLDMLEAQMNLRRNALERGRGVNAEEEDDEDAVIYVEGQEEEDNSADEEELDDDNDDNDDGQAKAPYSRALRAKALEDTDAAQSNAEDDDDGDDVQPATNGPSFDAGDVSDSEEDGVNDDEASESGDNTSEELDDEDIDHESVDTESSDGEASLPPKRPAKGELSNGIGARGH